MGHFYDVYAALKLIILSIGIVFVVI